MSSPFELMANAAKEANTESIKREESAAHAFEAFFKQFGDYCELPSGSMTITPWIEKDQVFRHDGEIHGVLGSMKHDEANDEWGLGIHIRLSPANSSNLFSVQFAVFLKQEDGKLQFRTAKSLYYPIDTNKQIEWNGFFAAIVEYVLIAFKRPLMFVLPTEQPNEYGFVANINNRSRP